MLWIKSFHIISVVCWFAAIFYLPRLFVHHTLSADQPTRERLKIMERKLYRGIMTPSAVLTLIFGGWLVSFNPQYFFASGWFHAKLTIVFLLLVYHWWCYRLLLAFRDDRNRYSHVFYRIFNEVPVLALIAIVILVVVKPF